MLMYLGELSLGGHTPTARQFGVNVLAANADVLTFNYDTLAEAAIELRPEWVTRLRRRLDARDLDTNKKRPMMT